MIVHSLAEPNLDDVLEFNSYLLTLLNAGVPIALGVSEGSDCLKEKLEQIHSMIAVGMARGRNVREVLEADQQLPKQYRAALLTWLFCDRSPDALASLTECASGREKIERILGFSFRLPMLLFALVYFGFLFLLLFLVPKLEGIYTQIGIEPGSSLQSLMLARQSIWWVVIVVPFVVVIGSCIWQMGRPKWSFAWFPGRSGVAEAIGRANYADGLASLIESSQTTTDALATLGTPNDNDISRGMMVNHTNRNTHQLPPLLNWATGDLIGDSQRSAALRFSAQAYRVVANSRSSQWLNWFSAIVGVVMGGLIVLFFGLCLFVPMIELLNTLLAP